MNYQVEMEKIISNLNNKPSLLLHACCGPCSSYVLELLSSYFNITVYYYNPNIYPVNEYKRRRDELIHFLEQFDKSKKMKFIEAEYIPEEYYSFINGYENYKEGSNRCFKCYELRLRKTVEYAKSHNYDYFATTLSISPYKNSNKLNEIGSLLEKEYNIKYLYSDFKKKNGFKRSLELSHIYNLYRQEYCGCKFSIRDEKSINN